MKDFNESTGDARIAAGLAETVRALRRELADAMTAGKDEQLRFQLGPVQLDVTVAVTKEGGADAGVRFGVISFGAKGQIADEATHRLSLSLTPLQVDSDGAAREAIIRGRVQEEPT